MKPVVMLCFARSGGTLLGRILGTDPSIVLISEVNSLIGATPDHEAVPPEAAMRRQLRAWYDLDFPPASFSETLASLLGYCAENGKKLVVRDWTFIDYYPSTLNAGHPRYKLSTLQEIQALMPVNRFALVRDAIDVLLSMGAEPKHFAPHYLRYIHDLIDQGIPIIRYEDLVSNPLQTLSCLNSVIGGIFNGELSRYNSNARVTGDIQLQGMSRGIRANVVRPIPRKWISYARRRRLESNAELTEANLLLGYPTIYDNGRIETLASMLGRKLYNRYLRLRLRRKSARDAGGILE